MTADYVAPHAGGAEARSRLRTRFSPWRLLVATSATVLIAAIAVMAGLWALTADRTFASYSASGALLGIEIDVARGNVEILGGGGRAGSATERAVYGHEPVERRTIESGVLRIESQCAALVVGSCQADYRIAVPESVSITIVAERGDVRLAGYRGSAQIATNGGSISVGAFCGHKLQATARGGSIDVTAICAPEDLALRTDSGNVTAAPPPGRSASMPTRTWHRRRRAAPENDIDAPWTIQALSNSGDERLTA